MNIPEEAIEAAADASPSWCGGEHPISVECSACRTESIRHARATLEAAAPIIAAQTLRDEANRLAELANIHAATNLWFVVDAIRARADKLGPAK